MKGKEQETVEENPRTGLLLKFSSSRGGTDHLCPSTEHKLGPVFLRQAQGQTGAVSPALGFFQAEVERNRNDNRKNPADFVQPVPPALGWQGASKLGTRKPCAPNQANGAQGSGRCHSGVTHPREAPHRTGGAAPTTDPMQHSLRAASLQSASSRPQKKPLGTVWDQVYIFIF